jgi:hypothetical protein
VTFPLTNIALLLWLGVVKLYDQDMTTKQYKMTQSNFGNLVGGILGWKFVRFMSGFKNTPEVTGML